MKVKPEILEDVSGTMGMPLLATQYRAGIEPTVERGILDSSSQSSLVFPSGIVWVYAALARRKESPVHDF